MSTRPASRIEACLQALCIEHGDCVPGDAMAELVAHPPSTAEAFVDAVLKAQGLDPLLVDRAHRSGVSAIVRDWMFDDDGRGSRSGLPRLPGSSP